MKRRQSVSGVGRAFGASSPAKQLAQALEASQRPNPERYLRDLGWEASDAAFIAMLLGQPNLGTAALPSAINTMESLRRKGRDRRV